MAYRPLNRVCLCDLLQSQHAQLHAMILLCNKSAQENPRYEWHRSNGDGALRNFSFPNSVRNSVSVISLGKYGPTRMSEPRELDLSVSDWLNAARAISGARHRYCQQPIVLAPFSQYTWTEHLPSVHTSAPNTCSSIPQNYTLGLPWRTSIGLWFRVIALWYGVRFTVRAIASLNTLTGH